ncbi:MAG: hypothetical protein ACRDXD_12155 [Acidimicrobiia bacterium]
MLVAQFEADYFGAPESRFTVLAPTGEVLEETARLVATSDLHAYYAIQLASALAARGADPECSGFACFDKKLREAASAEGFVILTESNSRGGPSPRG